MAAKWRARRFAWPEAILVADGPDGLDGFVCALADRDPPLIDNLHVRPGAQGRGTGARLLRAVRDVLAERGLPRAYLTVLESNPRGLAFYLREGGVDEGPVGDTLVGHPVRARRIGFGP
nr:GNAT family N-acetyltransferase [Jannaschia sp. Os4]